MSKVDERLEALCSEHPKCRTVAYADLSIGMVLVAAGPEKLSREGLDKLCSEASITLANGEDGVGTLQAKSGVCATSTHTKVFLRSEEEPNDVLLCLCDPQVDLGKFLSGATSCLQDVSGGAA